MNYIDFIADPARDCAVIVHRGIWQAAPENSLLAIERAIEGGYDCVEIDVRRSADGELVLLHDDTLARMAGVDAAPEALMGQDLLALRLRNRDGGDGNAMTDDMLPSLRQVFELTCDRIFLHLDIKHRAVIPDVIALAQEMGVDQQVDFWGSIETADDLAWVRQAVEPHGVLFLAKSRLNVPDAETQMDLLFKLSPYICEIYFDGLEQVAARKPELDEAGIALWVNTLDAVSCAGLTDTAAMVNPEAVWGALIDAGISAIQTDEAAALKAFIASRKR